jgi:hypothetical protein
MAAHHKDVVSYSKGLIVSVVALGVTFAGAFGVVVLLGGSGSFHDWPTPPRAGESAPQAPQQLRHISPSELANLALAPPTPQPPSRTGSSAKKAGTTAQLAGQLAPGPAQAPGATQAAVQAAPAGGSPPSVSATIAATSSTQLVSVQQSQLFASIATLQPASSKPKGGPKPTPKRPPAKEPALKGHGRHGQARAGHASGHGKAKRRRNQSHGHAGHAPQARPVGRHLAPVPRRHPQSNRGHHRGWAIGRRLGHAKAHGHARPKHHGLGHRRGHGHGRGHGDRGGHGQRRGHGHPPGKHGR